MKTEQVQSAEEITFKKCKDQIARERDFRDYYHAANSVGMSWWKLNHHIEMTDEAAELYASLKTKSLQDQLEAKEKLNKEYLEALKGMCAYWEWSIKDPHFKEYSTAKSIIQRSEAKQE
jgi:hypothetical protein